MSAAARRGAPLLLAAALALPACGGDSGSSEKEAEPVGERLVESVAPLAQCSDWNRGTRAERIATIHDIRQQVNLKDSAVQTPELDDDAAYEVLDNTCRRPFAATFRLYKVYARADSFARFATK